MNIPTKGNAALATVLQAVNNNVELNAIWEASNIMAVKRLGMSDHGPTHVTIVSNLAVKILRNLISAGVKPSIVDMTPEGAGAKGVYTYAASIPCGEAGRHGFVFRILPRHEDLANPHDAGLIFWA